ncbi:fluoride efflux transporter CrcB [Staphylococcus sp. 17KM0847]|uniref:fluoride efflux transporter CrcB n=1 Tax=Staphylococcus sp. 17KM0847 TaxID=2583989 RepID=UPI0015DC6290|nr:fluoride efflux transporter CrcB [Staphylococcus sp. 17KM0847]QLK86313.1 fluoride efflux transporter CrcB [Staphylococcus sp. 17KM0847]
MPYFTIFIGGSIGAILRYIFSLLPTWYELPVGTLIANFVGAYYMGYLFARRIPLFDRLPCLKKAITTGLLGALTTFSTFQYELLYLFTSGSWLTFICYAVFSYLGGLTFCYIGYRLGGQ